MLYEVKIDRIEAQMEQMKKCYQVLEEVKGDEESLSNQFALARALHLGVECMIDIGNSIIDGFIMRDPGGYHDIVDIMEDEQVVSKELAEQIHKKVDFRDRLVRYYHLLEPEELLEHSKDGQLLLDFIQSVTQFLNQEFEKGHIERTVKQ